MELVQISFMFKSKNTITTNFLVFFLFFPHNFPSWIRLRILNAHTDPDLGGKMNTDPDRDPQPCPCSSDHNSFSAYIVHAYQDCGYLLHIFMLVAAMLAHHGDEGSLGLSVLWIKKCRNSFAT